MCQDKQHINFTYYTYIKYFFIMLYDLILTYATQVCSQKHEKHNVISYPVSFYDSFATQSTNIQK